MAQDDIPGVRGAPGGPGGHQGAPGGARLLPMPKMQNLRNFETGPNKAYF